MNSTQLFLHPQIVSSVTLHLGCEYPLKQLTCRKQQREANFVRFRITKIVKKKGLINTVGLQHATIGLGLYQRDACKY